MEIIKTLVNTTLGSPILTLDSTLELFAGLNVYGNGSFPVCTKISSVDTTTKVTLSNNAIATGIYSIKFADIVPYMYLDKCSAMHEVQRVVNEIGQYVEFDLRGETNVTRDDYNSIKTRAQAGIKRFKAYPVTYNPSIEQVEKAGLKEVTDVIIYTAYQDWIDAGYTIDKLDMVRATIKLNGYTFEVKDKNLIDTFGNSYLYMTIGLNKK